MPNRKEKRKTKEELPQRCEYESLSASIEVYEYGFKYEYMMNVSTGSSMSTW